MSEQKNCAQRVENARDSRMQDLKVMYRLHQCTAAEIVEFLEDQGIEIGDDVSRDSDAEMMDSFVDDIEEAQGNYGLAFDYVIPDNDDRGYWRYQISYGGPSEEIRFFGDHNIWRFEKAVFWYLDWFDGAFKYLDDDQEKTAKAIWEMMCDCEILKTEYDRAVKDAVDE